MVKVLAKQRAANHKEVDGPHAEETNYVSMIIAPPALQNANAGVRPPAHFGHRFSPFEPDACQVGAGAFSTTVVYLLPQLVTG